MAKLQDVIQQIRGVSYKPEDIRASSDADAVPLLRANNIKDGKLNFDDVVYVDKRKVGTNQYLQPGDILICASSGSKELVGKAAYVEPDFPMTFGAFCKVARPQKGDPHYIGHYFESPYYRLRISEAAAGVNINNIRNEHIDVLDIPFPPINEQVHIAFVLDKIGALIDFRKRQLAKLDKLVKARFVELFGDPIKNKYGWNIRTVSDCCEKILGGGTPSTKRPEYYAGNIPWVSPKDMKGTLIADSKDHISKEGLNNSATKIVPANSVLMVIRSGILKHDLPLAINTVPVTINQDMKAFITKDDILPSYLMYYFKAVEKDILSGVRVVTADNIDFSNFLRRIVNVPPIEQQERFAAFVCSIEKMRLTIRQGLDKLETLKRALMQEYFGGGET